MVRIAEWAVLVVIPGSLDIALIVGFMLHMMGKLNSTFSLVVAPYTLARHVARRLRDGTMHGDFARQG